MPFANFAPSCPKCQSITKVASTLHDKKTYDLIRRRKCTACGHAFYTRQSREEMLDLSLTVRWGQGADMKNVQLIRKP